MKNPYLHIVPMPFTDYSLPVGLPVRLPVLGIFLTVGKGVERTDQAWSFVECCNNSPTDNVVLQIGFSIKFFLGHLQKSTIYINN
jgi:hypothetical protein